MRRELCIMACAFCRDPQFRSWIDTLQPPELKRNIGQIEFTEPMAKAFILHLCGIESRNELDTNPDAAERFHQLIRAPFLEWKEAQHAEQ